VVFGAAGVVLGSIGDSDSGTDTSPLLFGVIGAGLGAVLGLLIGGAVAKS
jgi:hypothetical protein